MSVTSPAARSGTPPGLHPLVWCSVALVAVSLRFWFSLEPWGLAQDSVTFLEVAQQILDGEYFERWSLRMLHPGYPAAIAAIGSLGPDLEAAGRWVSMLSSVATVLLALWWWARHGRRLEAAVLGTFAAVHSGSVIFGQDVFVEALWFALLVVAFAWAARPPSWRAALFCGLALGAAAVVKTTALYFTPGLTIALLWEQRADSWRLRLGRLTLVGGVVLLCILPFFVHGELAASAVSRLSGASRGVAEAHATGEMWSAHIEDAPLQRAADGSISSWSLWAYSARALVQVYLPQTLYPWFLLLPTALLGGWILARREDVTGAWWRITTVSVVVELALMCALKIESRYALPAVLSALPAAAVGVAALVVRARTATVAWRRRVAWVAVALFAGGMLAAWVYGVVRTGQRNRTHVNGYRDAGVWLEASGLDPRRVVSANREVAWRAGARRVAFARDAFPQGVPADAGTIVVLGPAEVGDRDRLQGLRSLAVGDSAAGWTVVYRNPTVTLLEPSTP